jgi:hypothetical protein
MLVRPFEAGYPPLKTLLKSRTDLNNANYVPRCVHILATELFIFNIKCLQNTFKPIYRNFAGG